MNLIDCSYFYAGPLQIMNAEATGDLDNNAYAVQQHITGYIERYQSDFLSKMLGGALAATVMSALAEGDTDDIEDLCELLRLPFAHYVYFKIAGDANQVMTATGLVRLKSANDYQPPRQRMVSVWNDMVELNKQFLAWAETSDYEVYYQVNMVTPINHFNI